MKIAFVDGPWPHYGHRTQRWAHKNPGGNINPPPLFQMYAASVARERGFDVELWDAPVRDMSFEALVDEICRFSPDVVVQNTSTPSFDHDMKLAKMLRPRIDGPLVMVGPHVTALAEDVLTHLPEVDIIALGEYDETIADISSNLGDPASVKGIVFRSGGEIVRTEARELIRDLDTLPYPAWDKVHMNDYWESLFPVAKKPVATIMTSRGCNFNCSFCLYPQVLFRNRLRFRRILNVVQEIQWLKEEFGAKFFYMEDDNFGASWKRVEEFCATILRYGLNITWACLARTDGVTEEGLRLMKESGCFLIKFGVEAGSQEQLDHIEKKNRLDSIKLGFDLCRKVGIVAHATVMLGIPGETKETILTTRAFLKTIAPDSVQFSMCTPFPGTRFWEECRSNQWLDYDRWEDFDGVSGGVLSYPHLSKREIKKAVNESYLDYYSSPAHIRQRIRRSILGPERASQWLRNLWLLKRLAMVSQEKLKERFLDQKGDKCFVDCS
jgi:radical SAM superfamily enzyme YgiQ (UPF0313 family)